MPANPINAVRNNPKKSAATAIAAALLAVYAHEGGFVDHKADRGGPTNHGITQAVARQWGYTGHMKNFPKSCDDQHPVCADLIYHTDYIKKPGFEPFATLEPAILDELVDSGVVHGPSKPSRWLQVSLNAECGSKLQVDGKVGPATVGAYIGCQTSRDPRVFCVAMLNRMDAAQSAYFDAIVAYRPSQRVFLKGWKRWRLNNVPRSKCGSGLV